MNKLHLPLVAGLASSFILSQPTHAAMLGQNLIVNGNAEQGLGDFIGNAVGADIPAISGWNTTGDFSVLVYGATGFSFVNALGNVANVTLPAVDVTGPGDRGQNLFFGGAERSASSAAQSIDVTSLTAVIDAGRGAFNLSAWLGGYDTDQDIASLNIEFFDQVDQSLGTASITAPNAAERNNITGLFFRSNQDLVPVGTRKINVLLNAIYARGRVNDAYADNLSLVITQVPEPYTSALILMSISCIAVLKLPKKRSVR